MPSSTTTDSTGRGFEITRESTAGYGVPWVAEAVAQVVRHRARPSMQERVTRAAWIVAAVALYLIPVVYFLGSAVAR